MIATSGFVSVEPLMEDLSRVNLKGIRWVIVGGESGPKARPMKLDWILNVNRQCKHAAFFFKRWGGWGADGKKRAKKQNGRLLEGRTWDAVPAGHAYYQPEIEECLSSSSKKRVS